MNDDSYAVYMVENFPGVVLVLIGGAAVLCLLVAFAVVAPPKLVDKINDAIHNFGDGVYRFFFGRWM